MTLGMLRRRTQDQSGFTLVEVMVTIVILLVGMAAVVTMVDRANAATVSTQAREAATALTRELIEDTRSVPYRNLTAAALGPSLQGFPGMADSTPSDATWTVERRGTVFTVALERVCTEDDGKDGYATHTGGSYCADAAESTPPDRNPEDYRRVTISVSWNATNRSGSTRQTTLVANPTSEGGPRIVGLSRDPNDDPITSSGTSLVRFSVDTDLPASKIIWSVDGGEYASIVPTGTTSTWDWPINSGGVLERDGTYVVSATPYDAGGNFGATRSLTVRLNRYLASRPQGLVGGWNATRGIVDMDWRAVADSDVVGYLVERVVDGVPQEVCRTSPSVTTCSDETPPSSGTSFEYRVWALDQDPATGGDRKGVEAATLPVNKTTNRPNAPTGLTLNTQTTASGELIAVDLTWGEPRRATPPYSGNAIRFYRIYRDGELVENRYGRTGSETQRNFTDTEPGAGGHQYWVTAVDSNYSESAVTGPVPR